MFAGIGISLNVAAAAGVVTAVTLIGHPKMIRATVDKRALDMVALLAPPHTTDNAGAASAGS